MDQARLGQACCWGRKRRAKPFAKIKKTASKRKRKTREEKEK
jgi:hypothetical protein